VKHHTEYRCVEEIERLQTYSGSMARADSEKGSTKSFYDFIIMHYLTGGSTLALRESTALKEVPYTGLHGHSSIEWDSVFGDGRVHH